MADEPQLIKPIEKFVVHRICAGQVILDLSSVVKELVKNSLDVGATTVEIVLKDFDKDSFGYGIFPNNFKVLALKYRTLKLADFPNIESLTTFGFRESAVYVSSVNAGSLLFSENSAMEDLPNKGGSCREVLIRHVPPTYSVLPIALLGSGRAIIFKTISSGSGQKLVDNPSPMWWIMHSLKVGQSFTSFLPKK